MKIVERGLKMFCRPRSTIFGPIHTVAGGDKERACTAKFTDELHAKVLKAMRGEDLSPLFRAHTPSESRSAMSRTARTFSPSALAVSRGKSGRHHGRQETYWLRPAVVATLPNPSFFGNARSLLLGRCP